MAKLQLISCFVNLGGDRNNAVYRGPHNPVTFPEALILQSVHGGQEHVHTMIDVGTVEREIGEEMQRLTSRYGKVVADLFPMIGGRPSLPLGDETIPTLDAVKEANAAAAEAMASAKSKRKPSAKKSTDADAPAPAAVPSLDDLPGGN